MLTWNIYHHSRFKTPSQTYEKNSFQLADILTLTLPGPSAGVSGSLDSYCSLKPLCSGMMEVVLARTSPTLLPHPLALCCHYPVSKCRSASIAVTCTVRVKQYSLHIFAANSLTTVVNPFEPNTYLKL